MKQLFNQLAPFILAGIAIVALAFGLMLLAYLFFFGAIIGMILFSIIWLRNKFFPRKHMVKTKTKTGRIIDSDDWKKL